MLEPNHLQLRVVKEGYFANMCFCANCDYDRCHSGLEKKKGNFVKDALKLKSQITEIHTGDAQQQIDSI